MLARTPGSKGLLHSGVREQRVAQIAQDWTVHATGNVRTPCNFLCRDVNLEAVAVRVGDGRAIYDAVESGPKRIGHAHRAWLAGGIHRVPGQGWALQLLAGKANGARLGVGTRIVLAKNCIGRAHQSLTRARIDDQCAEGDRVCCFQGARGELEDFAHALFVRCRNTHECCCQWHPTVIYHAIGACAPTLASNFCMEPIRQVSGKRSMLFFGLGAALAGAGFFLKPTKSRGPQGFGFRCGRANMSKFAVRTCCLLLLAGLFALGCRHSSSETGLAKVTLQADWYPQPEHGGFYTALAKGYYKDEGLDVTIQPGGPYVSMEKQVSVGLAQFGMSASDRTLEAVAGGQPLVAVAATMQRDPQGIMVHKDSPIRSFADLNGHTISIKPGYTWFAYLVKRYHLNDIHEIPATMSVANFVADPQYIQQAFATSEPFFARQAGIETRVLLTSDAGYNPYRVMFTSQDFLKRHPEVVA